jgi:hypothetical protein
MSKQQLNQIKLSGGKMATDAQKQERLLKVFNIGMYSMVDGLWDLFGESAFATTQTIGDRILSVMERESGLEINGEDPQAILNEVVRLLVDEVGTMKEGKVVLQGDKVSMSCKKCFLTEATGWLEAEGVQPFACIPMNISAAAMRKRLGVKHKVIGRLWDEESQTCTIQFQLVHS